MQVEEVIISAKQLPTTWFARFTLFMKNFEYKQSNYDYTLFFKWKKMIKKLV